MLLYAASMDGQGAIAIQAGKDYAKRTGDSVYHVLTLLRFGRFLLPGRLAGFSQSKRANEQSREQGAAKQCLQEEGPGRRETGQANRQRLNPSREGLCIAGQLQPGSRVGDQIEDQGAQHAAGEEL